MDAIIGATGALGNLITRSLLADGRQVVAVTRNRSRADPLVALGAIVREADLTDHASLGTACAGCECAVSSVHAMLGRGRNRSEDVDGAGQQALIDAAQHAGVQHFVLVSIIGASSDHPIDFWRAKFRAEQHLRASGMGYTIVRPTMFMETHAHMLIGEGIVKSGRATMLGGGDRKANFVAARDVARLVTRVLREPRATNSIIEIGGPENLTRNDVAALYGQIVGRTPRVRHIPQPVVRALSVLARPLHPGISRVMRVSIVMAARDETFDPGEMLRRFPMRLTTLEEFVRERIA